MTRTRTPAFERFWPLVNQDGPTPENRPDLGPCWLWTGAANQRGHGRFWDGERPVSAYVWSWTDEHGPIPEGLEPDHLCRVPQCVRPSHLEMVTHSENLRRSPLMGIRNRRKTHCPQGHPYDEANTIRTASGRVCRACRSVRTEAAQPAPRKRRAS